MHPRYRTAIKTPAGSSTLYVGQPEPLPFKYFDLNTMQTSRGIKYNFTYTLTLK